MNEKNRGCKLRTQTPWGKRRNDSGAVYRYKWARLSCPMSHVTSHPYCSFAHSEDPLNLSSMMHSMLSNLGSIVFALAALKRTAALPHSERQEAGAAISADFNQCESVHPRQYGSGVTYGFNATEPSKEDIEPLNLRYFTTGGASNSSPGWAVSQEGFDARIRETARECQRAHSFNAICLVRLSDLWGADGSQPADLKYPGDNGDWSSWDSFIKAVIDNAAGTAWAYQDQTQWLLWNEPDTKQYWPRDAAVFYEAFSRAATALHTSSIGSTAKIWGPSIDAIPNDSNQWLADFFAHLKGKQATSRPDVWDWHIKRDTDNDPVKNLASFHDAVKKHIPDLNNYAVGNSEYGTKSQQRTGYSAWYLARYSQAQVPSVRSNHDDEPRFHSDLAGLLLPSNFPGETYSKAGDYFLYKTYATMSTQDHKHCQSDSLNDLSLVTYATCTERKVTILIGTPDVYNGAIDLKLSGLSGCLKNAKSETKIRSNWYRLYSPENEGVNDPILIEGLVTAIENDAITVKGRINDRAEGAFVDFFVEGEH
ncbi:unnamed protein product [Sympodiomycopsis kandeliae]